MLLQCSSEHGLPMHWESRMHSQQYATTLTMWLSLCIDRVLLYSLHIGFIWATYSTQCCSTFCSLIPRLSVWYTKRWRYQNETVHPVKQSCSHRLASINVVAIETKTHFVLSSCLPSPPTSCLQVPGSKTIRHHAPWWLWAWIWTLPSGHIRSKEHQGRCPLPTISRVLSVLVWFSQFHNNVSHKIFVASLPGSPPP